MGAQKGSVDSGGIATGLGQLEVCNGGTGSDYQKEEAWSCSMLRERKAGGLHERLTLQTPAPPTAEPLALLRWGHLEGKRALRRAGRRQDQSAQPAGGRAGRSEQRDKRGQGGH